MREIKFRAYDRKTKKMLNSVGFYDNDCGRTLIEEGYMIGGGETHNFYDFDYNTQKHRFELMQYTGLKDANGKEIYDRDIITSNYHNDLYDYGFELTSLVEFRNGCFWLNVHNCELHYYSEFCTVIGNIYENPELLEVKE